MGFSHLMTNRTICLCVCSEYLRFDLDHDEVVVVSRKDAIECSAEILETHCIPAAKSIGPLASNSHHKDKDGNKLRGKKHPSAKRNGKPSGPGDHRANGLPKRNQNKRASRKPNKKFGGEKNGYENGADNAVVGGDDNQSTSENKSLQSPPAEPRRMLPAAAAKGESEATVPQDK